MEKIRLGWGICGSYCTFSKVFDAMAELCIEKFDIHPIISNNVQNTDSRFMTREEMYDRIGLITSNKPILTIQDAEPIGPKKTLDAIVIAPCTGNTLAKLAGGITDTPVTMAVKAALRNEKPIIIAISSNDSLSTNLKNVGTLMNSKNIYFVPFSQDDAEKKPTSLVAHFDLIEKTVEDALIGKQTKPLIV